MYHIEIGENTSIGLDAAAYETLVQAVPHATVFNGWPWVSTAMLFAGDAQVLFLTCRANGKLCGVIPLRVAAERHYGVMVKVCRFLQYPWGDRMTIVLHPDHLACWPLMLEALSDELGQRWDWLVLNEWWDPQGLVHEAMTHAKELDWDFYTRGTSKCPVFFLDGQTAHAVLAGYSAKLRNRIKRSRKRLEATDHKIEHIRPTPDAVAALVLLVKDAEKQSWKGDSGLGIFSTSEGAAFFDTLSRALAALGQLELALVWIDGEVASYRFGFYYQNTFFDYSLGYLPKYQKLGLGRVLLDEIILNGAREGYRAVDASRVSAVSQNLLFERTQFTVEHTCVSWFSRGFKGGYLRFLEMVVKPFVKNVASKIRRYTVTGSAK